MAAQYVTGTPTRPRPRLLGRLRGDGPVRARPGGRLDWGSLDAGAARMSGPEARAAVPADAVFVEIPGGNHEQMGWYTGQPNDPPATISRVDQQAQVAARR